MLTSIYSISRVNYHLALLTYYNLHFTKQEHFFNYDVRKLLLKYVHMGGEMNSYWFEISNWRENKFCSHEVSFGLYFKEPKILVDISF